MSRTSPAVAYVEFYDGLIAALEEGAEWKLARMSLDIGGMMVPEIRRRFFLDIQSVNANSERGTRLTLTRHTVTVAFAVPTTHGQAGDAMRDALARERQVSDALMDRANALWMAQYVSTSRKLNSTRELFIVQQRFALSVYHRMAY